jgi:hypothetical protein
MQHKATKYTKVKFNAKVIVRRYQKGMTVAAIARACGYPAGAGQNRVTNALKKAGVYKTNPSK